MELETGIKYWNIKCIIRLHKRYAWLLKHLPTHSSWGLSGLVAMDNLDLVVWGVLPVIWICAGREFESHRRRVPRPYSSPEIIGDRTVIWTRRMAEWRIVGTY